ncbi:MAG: Kdo hydroxylase family protein [Janthinobacterium lividum]
MTESQILEFPAPAEAASFAAQRADAVAALEAGKVLYFPVAGFSLLPAERALLDPALADPRRKNISLSPNGLLVGLRAEAPAAPPLANAGAMPKPRDARADRAAVQNLITRFTAYAGELVDTLLPAYRGHLRAAPASLRLHRVEGRASSWRADDSRLHVDAFPSRPNRGERILRVFTNINDAGEARVWRVGEPFEAMAQRLLPRIKPQLPGSAALLAALHITKSRRTPYDHLMLGLHDAMKADAAYQRECPQQRMPFPPGSTWVCFSDQTSHAVMTGQFMLEQTLFLPAAAMVRPDHAPLAILERLRGRALI